MCLCCTTVNQDMSYVVVPGLILNGRLQSRFFLFTLSHPYLRRRYALCCALRPLIQLRDLCPGTSTVCPCSHKIEIQLTQPVQRVSLFLGVCHDDSLQIQAGDASLDLARSHHNHDE